MSYLPTLCDGCHRVSLESFSGFIAGAPECRSCGQELRVIPSRNYSAKDVQLFNELMEVVGTHLSALEAAHFSVALQKALASGSWARLFEPLARRWPGLVPLLVSGPHTSRRSLQMLKTIFDALSLTRASGMMSSRDISPAPSPLARVQFGS
jgi:hypothetical protein